MVEPCKHDYGPGAPALAGYLGAGKAMVKKFRFLGLGFWILGFS
jgi:hypothetical protein